MSRKVGAVPNLIRSIFKPIAHRPMSSPDSMVPPWYLDLFLCYVASFKSNLIVLVTRNIPSGSDDFNQNGYSTL